MQSSMHDDTHLVIAGSLSLYVIAKLTKSAEAISVEGMGLLRLQWQKRSVARVLNEDSILTHKLTRGDNCDV
jgi:hypothetical protein